jgi:hypothetical protein
MMDRRVADAPFWPQLRNNFHMLKAYMDFNLNVPPLVTADKLRNPLKHRDCYGATPAQVGTGRDEASVVPVPIVSENLSAANRQRNTASRPFRFPSLAKTPHLSWASALLVPGMTALKGTISATCWSKETSSDSSSRSYTANFATASDAPSANATYFDAMEA